MKLTQDYEGHCKVYYGYNLAWKPWLLYWEEWTQTTIYIVYNSIENIIYHYKDETKTELLDHYIFIEDETDDNFYTRHNESKNTNYRTKNIIITQMLS